MTEAALSVRPYTEQDRDDLVALLLSIPSGEHMFVKRDIADIADVRAWLDDTPAQWTVATRGAEFAGAAAVIARQGWSSHVSEIRMVVAPAHRRRGVGAALARGALLSAVEHGSLVVTVEVLAEQQGVVTLFRGLGFVPEALLTDQVRDAKGGLHDLVVLAHSVPAVASRAQSIGALDLK